MHDCGQHEWHNIDYVVDHCYHCEVGVRPHRLMHVPVDDEFRTMLVRGIERGSEVDAEILGKLHEQDRLLGRPRWHPPTG